MIIRLIMLLVIFLETGICYAITSAQKGLEIALETERRDKDFGDYSVEGTMTLTSPDGAVGQRQFKMYTLEVQNDGDKRLVEFVQPRDLAGMISLTYSHGLEADDQWLYMPVLRRTKRLAARDKTGSFAGSEFAFEDISTWEVKKYTYKHLRDEALEGKATFVVENTPSYPYSGYSRIMEWVDQSIYHPLKLVYFDKAGNELKELRFYDYRQYQNRYWRPGKVVMTNFQTGAVSTIEWKNYTFQTGLTENKINPGALRRWAR